MIEKLIAFILIFFVLAPLCDWMLGSAAKLGGPEDPRIQR